MHENLRAYKALFWLWLVLWAALTSLLSAPRENDDLRAYTVPQVAEMLGISEVYLRLMIQRKEIRSIRAGRRVLVPAQAIKDFLTGMPSAKVKRPPPPV